MKVMTSRSTIMAAKKESGQALIELIIFLPFMLMMFMMVISLGNAINGSINQQKSVRGYFYYRLQNNSQITKRTQVASATNLGFFMIGWMDKIEGDLPVASCYKLRMPFGQAADDECEEGYATPTTQFVRVNTVYGVCGATIFRPDPSALGIPAPVKTGGFSLDSVVGPNSCVNN